ncbi:MAG: hypothetical protein H6745_12145 [Deltaproteobacteria bacterium]|nr:hypothetical protein [Deltaproteobacteria bacterium]
MSRLAIVLACALALPLLVLALAPTAAVAQPYPGEPGEVLAELHLRARFPSPPTVERNKGAALLSLTVPGGASFLLSAVPASDDAWVSPNPLAVFVDVANSAVAGFGGQIVEDETSLVDGHVARAFAVRGGRANAVVRVIVAGRLAVTALAAWPSSGAPSGEADARAFVASVALAPGAPADLPVTWSRRPFGAFTIESPSALVSGELGGVGATTWLALLPHPGVLCHVGVVPAGAGAVAEAQRLMSRLLGVVASETPRRPEKVGRLGAFAARFETAPGRLLPSAGGGAGEVHTAFVDAGTELVVFVCAARPDRAGRSSAAIERFWGSLRAARP